MRPQQFSFTIRWFGRSDCHVYTPGRGLDGQDCNPLIHPSGGKFMRACQGFLSGYSICANSKVPQSGACFSTSQTSSSRVFQCHGRCMLRAKNTGRTIFRVDQVHHNGLGKMILWFRLQVSYSLKSCTGGSIIGICIGEYYRVY